ncbi:MAG: GAF domain-containing protein, partial [Myxococcales bacterium]|nr:GAF domain-containing protein [Myxococcales bacterium]
LQALSDQLALTAHGKRPTATVHVPCNRRITHIVAVPILEDPGAETSLECLEREKGIGLPLWASLRKRTLWIRDLHASPFWNLATQREQQFTSLLVIPTFQADRLVAVIQLAWREPHDIDHAVLRPLAMATNQMMAKLESFARQSLTTLWGCLTQRVEDASRHEFFDIASRHFGVRDCDIWRVASDHKERLTFELEGSTYGEQPGSPRHNGWSAYVHTHGTHVYITRSPTNEPNVYEWDEDIGTWGSPRHDERPSSVNEVLTTLGVDAELGVPLSWGEARGVLWLKFQANATCDPRIHHPPGPHLMFAVRLFARSASRTMLSQTPRSPQRREPEVVIDKARASTVATLQTEPVLAEARQLNGKYSV